MFFRLFFLVRGLIVLTASDHDRRLSSLRRGLGRADCRLTRGRHRRGQSRTARRRFRRAAAAVQSDRRQIREVRSIGPDEQ